MVTSRNESCTIFGNECSFSSSCRLSPDWPRLLLECFSELHFLRYQQLLMLARCCCSQLCLYDCPCARWRVLSGVWNFGRHPCWHHLLVSVLCKLLSKARKVRWCVVGHRWFPVRHLHFRKKLCFLKSRSHFDPDLQWLSRTPIYPQKEFRLRLLSMRMVFDILE